MAHSLPIYFELFSTGKKPEIVYDTRKWESLALEKLLEEAGGYVFGSAGNRETDNKNLLSFSKWLIVPNRLMAYDGFPDLNTTIFGKTYETPIAMAPVGVQQIFHPEGELASAAAASEEEVPYILSSASCHPFDSVAQANGDGDRWYQLYWPSNENNDITASLLLRAKAAGYTVLVVTLDTFTLGWRPSDLDNAYNPFLKPDSIGISLVLLDPVYRQRFRDRNDCEVEDNLEEAALELARILFPGSSHSWSDLELLRKHWDGPIVLKGIQSVGDATKAAECEFVDGIVVSNHGGRQQDGGVASLQMLPHIAEAVGDKLEIIFDSGIRCGADIAKALALGAKMVLIGRPYVYGLALGGEEGVKHVLKLLKGDLELTLHISGIASVSKEHLNKGILYEETSVTKL